MNLARTLRKAALAAVAAAFIPLSIPLKPAQDDSATRANLDQAIDSTSQLIVMLTDQLGTAPAFGAGIVFGRDHDRLYIVTANHVVRRGAVEAANIRVAFKSMPDKPFPAKLLAQADRELDVAVVALEGWAGQGVDACKLPFDRLGEAGALQRGNTVYAIGNPNGENWRMPAPDRLYNIGPDQLAFQSAFIAVGSSGGALLNNDARIVGLVRRDEAPSGSAIPMSAVLPLVSKWGYPVQLRLGQPDGRTPLHAAAAAGEIDRIKAELAATCSNANVKDVRGITPLLYAAEAGQLEAVRTLLQGGANVKAKGSVGLVTALHRAAQRYNQPMAALLLNAGADVNARDYLDATPLGYVKPAKSDAPNIAQAKTEFVRFLIEAGADVNARSTRGDGLLHQALAAGNREMVAALLEAHADVNLKGRIKFPMEIAIESDDIDTFKLLLQAGADINRGAAFSEALHRKNGPLVALMLRSGARLPDANDVDVLQEAIREGWSDVVKILLEGRADVNLVRLSQTINAQGSTGSYVKLRPLGIAIEVNNPEMVKLLIANKANVNLGGQDGQTALHLAACKGDSALIKLLMGAGAQVKAVDSRQDTPLHVAVGCRNEEAAKVLLQAGAAVNALDNQGQTPVTLAKGTSLEGLLRSHSAVTPQSKK